MCFLFFLLLIIQKHISLYIKLSYSSLIQQFFKPITLVSEFLLFLELHNIEIVIRKQTHIVPYSLWILMETILSNRKSIRNSNALIIYPTFFCNLLFCQNRVIS